MSSLDDDRFIWMHEPTPRNPFRIVPVQGANGRVISYRRCVTLGRWCVDQFGPHQALVEHHAVTFQTEAQMTVFVAMWSGVEVPAIRNEDL